MTDKPEQDEAPVLGNEPLKTFWKEPVAKLATVGPFEFTLEQTERHRIYSLALMKLLVANWNGNKRGMVGTYPWREKQQWQPFKDGFLYRSRPEANPEAPEPKQKDYLGHNIAAIAVDGDGDIIDFEFNHNDAFSSSVEHAESRLVRRIFSLALLDEGWNLSSNTFGAVRATNLNQVTVYTSLEPCAQCSGIMTLAAVKEVVYLEKDYGTYCMANMLFNLTRGTPILAPRPVPASSFGFTYYGELNEAFKSFHRQVGEKPFWKDGNSKDTGQAVTSFLCTDDAFGIYDRARAEFEGLNPEDLSPNSRTVFENAKRFVKHAIEKGKRGTPHRL